jgi:hypothetical protein
VADGEGGSREKATANRRRALPPRPLEKRGRRRPIVVVEQPLLLRLAPERAAQRRCGETAVPVKGYACRRQAAMPGEVGTARREAAWRSSQCREHSHLLASRRSTHLGAAARTTPGALPEDGEEGAGPPSC